MYNNTAGTVGIYAGGDMKPIREAAPEAIHADVVVTHTSLAHG